MNNQPGIFWNLGGGGGLGVVPIFFGALLIVFGMLIFFVPKALEFIVAGVLVMAGCALVGTGWRMRGRVTYRNLDDGGAGSYPGNQDEPR